MSRFLKKNELLIGLTPTPERVEGDLNIYIIDLKKSKSFKKKKILRSGPGLLCILKVV